MLLNPCSVLSSAVFRVLKPQHHLHTHTAENVAYVTSFWTSPELKICGRASILCLVARRYKDDSPSPWHRHNLPAVKCLFFSPLMTCVCTDCNTPEINAAQCVTQACLKRKNGKCWKLDVQCGLYLKAHIHIRWVRHLLLHEAFTAPWGIYCSTPSVFASWHRHVQKWYCNFFLLLYNTISRD